MASNAVYSILELADGAKIAYEILGVQHLGSRQPLILIGGMSSRRIDWERLAISLAEVRPILLFDHRQVYFLLSVTQVLSPDNPCVHRGMGDSRLTPAKDEEITVECLAHDLLSLISHLQWKDVSLCGFSMGGVVAQQLLYLPYHTTRPVGLPCRITHVILAGTLCSPLKDRRYGLRVNKNVPTAPLNKEQKREIARPTLESTFDPAWLENPENSGRFQWWLERMISGGRPTNVILRQARALNKLNFDGYHNKLSKAIQVLVIHGELDEVVPFSCGQEILHRIPWAQIVAIGKKPGQVENYAFGHHWFEYFDIQVWHDVVEIFLSNQSTVAARL